MLLIIEVSWRWRGNVDAMGSLWRCGRRRRRRRDVGAMVGIVGVHIPSPVVSQVLLLLRDKVGISKGRSSWSWAC